VLDDLLAVAAAVEDELVPAVAGAGVNEVVVEAAAAEFVVVVLADAVAVEVSDSVSEPVVVADAALGPAYLVQKPNASLLLAVSKEKRYG